MSNNSTLYRNSHRHPNSIKNTFLDLSTAKIVLFLAKSMNKIALISLLEVCLSEIVINIYNTNEKIPSNINDTIFKTR